MKIIPKRFETADLSTLPLKLSEELKKVTEAKKSLYLYGPVGTGKTYTAYALTKHIGLQNVQFINLAEFLNKLRESYDYRDPEASHLRAEIASYECYLVIDDIGVERPTDWALEVIFGLINTRYENMYPTIITSNLSPAQLATHLGDRITSRIVGMSEVIELRGEDLRLK